MLHCRSVVGLRLGLFAVLVLTGLLGWSQVEAQPIAVVDVAASGFQVPNVPRNTLDGNLGTRWSQEGDGEWIRYDLGQPQMVSQVRIAWFRGDQRTSSFRLEVSLDASTWSSVFSGQSSGLTLSLQAVDIADVTTRFVRIVGFGSSENDWNSITEVEIHGPGSGMPTITLTGTLRDFNDSHPDFENRRGTDRGIVAEQLGADRKPVYAGGARTITTNGQAAFDQWYRDVPGVNQSRNFALTLDNRVTPDTNVFTFSSNAFFPIDNQLFGNQGRNHNFHFTLEVHTRFTYQGGEVFTFTGDDDLWVFINGQRVIDLGGIHPAQTETVSLDAIAGAIGIVPGNEYPFDLFFAERATSGSNFRIDTSIELEDTPGPGVNIIGVVPNVFSTDGGSFEVTVAPRDAAGNLITAGVTRDSFAFRDVRATYVADPGVTGVADTEVVDVLIRNATSGEPIALVLDFDSSGSMAGNDPNRLRVDAGRQALQFLVPPDQAAVIDFGARATSGLRASRLLQDFTSDVTLLNAAIDQVGAFGGTPFYDSVLDALGLLSPGGYLNPAIVVMTDGEDNASRSTAADVIAQANAQNDTPVCTIGLGSSVSFQELQMIARETGCTFAEATDAAALQAVIASVTRGVVEGRVLVTGMGRFMPPLAAGDYRVTGALVTTLNGQVFDTPFSFPVTLQSSARLMSRELPRPDVPYTAAEEAQGILW